MNALSRSFRIRLSGPYAPLVFAALALAVALVILNRWMFTALGLESFGRIWHLHVNYFEFGFNRRSLEGTIVHMTGLRRLFAGAYEFGFFWQSLKLAILTGLLFRMVQKSYPANETLFKAFLFLSPGLLWHYAYAVGNPDLLLVIIATVAVSFNVGRGLFVLLLFAGVLTHESFLFLIPGISLLYEYRTGRFADGAPRVLGRAVLNSLPAIALSAGLVWLSSHSPPSEAAYEAQMAAKLGAAAYKHTYWSGYFELFAAPQQFVDASRASLRSIPANWHFIFLPLLYTLALAAAVFVCVRGRSAVLAALMSSAALAPLGIFYLANDYYRWISLSCTMSLLILCFVLDGHGAGRLRAMRLKWLFIGLLPLSLLGPFGSNPVTHPFPITAFALKKLGLGS